jgi:hypothetical protein
VVADTVQLYFPAQLGKGFVVILVRFYMQILGCKGEVLAVDENGLENVRVAAP